MTRKPMATLNKPKHWKPQSRVNKLLARANDRELLLDGLIGVVVALGVVSTVILICGVMTK